MTFRRATSDDLEAILAMIARADAQMPPEATPSAAAVAGDRRRISAWLQSPDDHNEVAEIDGGVVGFANMRPYDGAAHIAYLYVDPSHQGQGIGARLLDGAVAEARRRGFRRMTLSTAVGNRGARRFYEREGWRDTGERRHHDELGLDMAQYALDSVPPVDEGLPIAYEVLDEGVPVYAEDGSQVGTVDHVVAAPEEDIFHGIVLRTEAGRRFVPADQVASLHERGVDLRIGADAVAALEEPGGGAPAWRDQEPGVKPSRWQHLVDLVTGADPRRRNWSGED